MAIPAFFEFRRAGQTLSDIWVTDFAASVASSGAPVSELNPGLGSGDDKPRLPLQLDHNR
jgi:hypothetical protein